MMKNPFQFTGSLLTLWLIATCYCLLEHASLSQQSSIGLEVLDTLSSCVDDAGTYCLRNHIGRRATRPTRTTPVPSPSRHTRTSPFAISHMDGSTSQLSTNTASPRPISPLSSITSITATLTRISRPTRLTTLSIQTQPASTCQVLSTQTELCPTYDTTEVALALDSSCFSISCSTALIGTVLIRNSTTTADLRTCAAYCSIYNAALPFGCMGVQYTKYGNQDSGVPNCLLYESVDEQVRGSINIDAIRLTHHT